MKARLILLTMLATTFMLTSCHQDDNIVPDSSVPFFGIYNPLNKICQVDLALQQNDTMVEYVPYLTANWGNRRLQQIDYIHTPNGMDSTRSEYLYDAEGRLVGIDDNIAMSYNDRGLLAVVKVYQNGVTHSYSFEYGDGYYPDVLADSMFYHDAADPTQWNSVVCAYRLEWKEGNLLSATAITPNTNTYHYSYNMLDNPLCGLTWSVLLTDEDPLFSPITFSRNGLQDVTITDSTGQEVARQHFGYEYNGSRPIRIYLSSLGSDISDCCYTLHYRR